MSDQERLVQWLILRYLYPDPERDLQAARNQAHDPNNPYTPWLRDNPDQLTYSPYLTR